MSKSNYMDVFEMIKYEISDSKSTERNLNSDESFFEEIINELQDFYVELMNKFTTLSEKFPIDLEYYREILLIENGKLKESNVDHDDPTYPIYKHVESLLSIHNHFKTSSDQKESNILFEDTLLKSILISKKVFLSNLNMAICDKYTLKDKNYLYKRIYVGKENKNEINIIILKHIDIQQMRFHDHLTASQQQLPEFIDILATFQIIKFSYDEFCKDENFGEIEEDILEIKTMDFDMDAIPHFKSKLVKFNNSFMPSFPAGLKPEALTLEQNYNSNNNFIELLRNTRSNKNVPIASSTSTNASYYKNPSFSYFSCLIFICIALGLFKRMF